jgi:hypothetical protein
MLRGPPVLPADNPALCRRSPLTGAVHVGNPWTASFIRAGSRKSDSMIRMFASIELEFNEQPDQKFSSHPIATILLKHSDRDPDGNPLLTRRCDTVDSLFAEIDRLEKRLLQIRQEAETKFRDAKNRENLTVRFPPK